MTLSRLHLQRHTFIGATFRAGRQFGLAAAFALLLLTQTGCISNFPTGQLRAVSQAQNPVQLDMLLEQGAYRVEAAQTSMYLSDRTLDELLSGDVQEARILHAQLLWIPKPGTTPVDPTATNVTLRLVLLTDGELGVYGGAGFAWPNGTPARDQSNWILLDPRSPCSTQLRTSGTCSALYFSSVQCVHRLHQLKRFDSDKLQASW